MNTLFVILGFAVLLALVFLAAGFIWMICLGALSHIFEVDKLAISYGESLVVAVISSLLFGGARTSRK